MSLLIPWSFGVFGVTLVGGGTSLLLLSYESTLLLIGMITLSFLLCNESVLMRLFVRRFRFCGIFAIPVFLIR